MLSELFRNNWIRLSKKYQPGIALLAVSGGEDSMVMAHLFYENKIDFAVAHCNFALRGEDADGDEQFVSDWCSSRGVRFHSVRFDTKQKAAEWKKGTQETARILRYEWFELIREQHKYSRIVTAHHANDNAETLLINLFKGTGISGLHGILHENGKIVRPLLFATKEMISAYAGANSIVFREDASNASDDYLRNAVRHKVIPAVVELFSNAISNLSESIVRFSEAEALYKRAIDLERKQLLEQRGSDYYVPVRKLRLHEPVTTICYELFRQFGFSARQTPHILDLLDAESGHFISSETHRIIRNRDFLIVTTVPTETADIILVEGAPAVIDTGKHVYKFSVQAVPKIIPADTREIFLDLAEVTFPLQLRKWRTGDYLYPLGMGMKKKKVGRLLIDQKVALHEKEDLRILESNKRIAWVSGIRIDERFKVKTSTKQVLVVKRETK